jgi:hypothetical protein
MADYGKSDTFDILNSKISELCHPADEVLIKFKGKVIFWKYIKKTYEIWHKNV